MTEKASGGRKAGNKNLSNPLIVCNDNQGSGDNHGENDNTSDNPDTQTGVLLKTRPKIQKPAMYKVLILNDDYTPMEFVVYVIERFFNKTRQEATDIMLHVHRRGVGVCGIYTYEVAETKVAMVMDYARQNEQPLQCTMEKE
jgi:ATP-dependent Clp protease adaptor protein ClpS